MSQARIENLRNAVFDDLSSTRLAFEASLDPKHSNSFDWHREAFWVDRRRRFVIPQLSASRVDKGAWTSKDTLPANDFEASELLDVYAGDYQHEDTASISRMLALFICGAESQSGWRLTGAKFINLAIAQPTINPAFGSLLWLGLAEDIGTLGDYRSNLFDLLKPMMHLQIEYPELRPEPTVVRKEQIAFLEGLFPGSTDSHSISLSDFEWAEHCREHLSKNQQFVDDRFFASLLEDVLALENSARSE